MLEKFLGLGLSALIGVMVSIPIVYYISPTTGEGKVFLGAVCTLFCTIVGRLFRGRAKGKDNDKSGGGCASDV